MKENIMLETKDVKNAEELHRKNDEGGLYFRSDRFYKINEEYYFSTREGLEIGPYGSKVDASSGLDRYIQSIHKDQNENKAKMIALSGEFAITNFQ